MIRIPSTDIPENSYSLVFLHGLGDEGNGWTFLKNSFYAHNITNINFIFPDAPQSPLSLNFDLDITSWYDLKSIENVFFDEDVNGILNSINFLISLINSEIRNFNVKPENIFIGGFSQGCALSILTNLLLNFKIGGVIALSGYIPIINTIWDILEIKRIKFLNYLKNYQLNLNLQQHLFSNTTSANNPINTNNNTTTPTPTPTDTNTPANAPTLTNNINNNNDSTSFDSNDINTYPFMESDQQIKSILKNYSNRFNLNNNQLFQLLSIPIKRPFDYALPSSDESNNSNKNNSNNPHLLNLLIQNFNTPIFLAHGKKDNAIKFKLSKRSNFILKEDFKLPIVNYSVYKNLNHSANDQEINDIIQFVKLLTTNQ
ncbi:alpha/beta-hydrolase [Ascoidea rubescens DSM 1968]|uniref:Acyl-protein thioesterase 1 n=1 Tax=Ascoidea rubescens DSM 1968 TaxID=1344418 RepID=A0A1D2VLS0_9ASCO|nr:alpha/beta-hydrolase [Ascoidea rubescens DSM 1968]ODV62542.1 alpha/beta-hydrolase [Ascoidea rubescens DSM 1968]